MLPDVHAVLFDLDGTLLDRRKSFEQFSQDQWQRFAHVLTGVEREQYVQLLIECDRGGYAPRDELFTSVAARYALPSGLAAALRDDFRSGFASACLLFPDAARTLSSLRTAGVALGLITNGSVRMQRAKLSSLALEPFFDAILISEGEGIHKPDRQIFDRALQRLNVTANHAVFVGDHPDVDVAGARGAGMRAIWRRGAGVPHAVEADGEIEELGDLLTLLGIARTAAL